MRVHSQLDRQQPFHKHDKQTFKFAIATEGEFSLDEAVTGTYGAAEEDSFSEANDQASGLVTRDRLKRRKVQMSTLTKVAGQT